MPSFVGLLFLLQCGESGILTENIIPRTGAKTAVSLKVLCSRQSDHKGVHGEWLKRHIVQRLK